MGAMCPDHKDYVELLEEEIERLRSPRAQRPTYRHTKIEAGTCKCGLRQSPDGRDREICYRCEAKGRVGTCAKCGGGKGAWSQDFYTLCSDCGKPERKLLEKLAAEGKIDQKHEKEL
jgi:hypothetical protein